MRWRNHKVVTFSLVYTATGGFVAALAAMFGSVLPDVLECGGVVRHRTITHYVWGWLSIVVMLWMMLKNTDYTSLLLYSVFFMSIGALLHVLEDALSVGGVPYSTPYGPRRGLGIYKTREISEEVTVWGTVVVLMFFSSHRGLLGEQYLKSQFELLLEIIKRGFHG